MRIGLLTKTVLIATSIYLNDFSTDSQNYKLLKRQRFIIITEAVQKYVKFQQ